MLEGQGFVYLSLAVDGVMLALAVAAAALGAGAAGIPLESAVALAVFPALVIALMYMRGLYRPRLRMLVLDGVPTIVGAISVAAMMSVALAIFINASSHPAPLVTRAWLFAAIYVSAGRMLLTLSQRRARHRGVLSRPALIVGAGVVGAKLARRLEEVPDYGLEPIGFLDADPPADVDVVDRRAPVLGTPSDLEEVVNETGAAHVILAFTSEPDAALLPLVRRCEELGLDVSLVPRLFDSINERISLEHLGGMPLLGLRGVDPQGWQFAIKHGLDRFAATLAVIALAPVFAIAALAVKLSSPGPIFYRQRRVGRDGQEFDLVKFRSMRLNDGPDDFMPLEGLAPGGVEGEDRRTSIGCLLRRTAVDELPQLFNVLRGEMSLVGPRPERPEFVALFGEGIDRYADRHRVRSGVTGWAQVNGYRGQTSIPDRVEWDNFYIENWSLWLDVKILLLTVGAVLRGHDQD